MRPWSWRSESPGMPEELTTEERRLVEELMALEDGGDRTESVLSQVPLVLGVIVFVAAAIITLRNLSDRTALWVMLPGTVVAIFLFGLYLVITVHRRVRRRYASIIHKLMQAAWRGDGPTGRIVRL